MFVIGRGFELATAREVALKLTETCGIAAEPLTATDLAHGPVAAIEALFPVWAIASHDATLAAVLEAAGRAKLPARPSWPAAARRPRSPAPPSASGATARTAASPAPLGRPGPALRRRARPRQGPRRRPAGAADEGDAGSQPKPCASPSPSTPSILAGRARAWRAGPSWRLSRAGVRGTFFVQGRWARSHPDQARQIAASGHLIGNHSTTTRLWTC